MFKYAKEISLYFLIPLLLDRITKYFVLSGIWNNKIINPIMNIYITYNRGIACGIGENLNQYGYWTLAFIIALVLLYFCWFTWHIHSHRNLFIASLLALSGGISNFFDRLWFCGVVDFIQLHIGEWYFPVFNGADVIITLGAIMLCYEVFMFEK